MSPFDEVPTENRRTTFGECNPCAVKTVHDVKSALRKLSPPCRHRAATFSSFQSPFIPPNLPVGNLRQPKEKSCSRVTPACFNASIQSAELRAECSSVFF
jgi:hypothetical protein